MSEQAPQMPPQTGTGPTGPRAGFGRRFVAALLDGLVVGIPFGILSLALEPGVAYAIGTAASLAYYTYFEGRPAGQTLGKAALGIRVIDFRTGGPIGYGRALIRWVGRILSSIPCFLGYLWMLWDKEKQTWHDKLATDVVVPTSAYPVS